MAVSRATQATAATNSTSGIPGAPKRVSFAKIREPLEVPNLLDLQILSFEWLTGSEAWFQSRVDAGCLRDAPNGGAFIAVLAELQSRRGEDGLTHGPERPDR